MKPLVTRCCFAVATCWSVGAAAQEPPAPTPITQPTDYGFGEHQLAERFEFPDETDYLGRVDRRGEIDATPHRTILWPTAYTPERLTVSLSSFMLNLNQLSFSPTDDLQLSATVLVPTELMDFQAGLAAKFSLAKTENTQISLQPLTKLRVGRGGRATRDVGAGVALLFDFVVTNNFVMTAGALGYGTAWFSKEVSEYVDCESRRDYISGACLEYRTESSALPRGGHFLAAQLAGTYYIFDSLSLRGEVFSGIAAGSVLGSEFVVRRPTPVEDIARFDTGSFALGVPYDSRLTVGMGLAWSNGLFAVQFSGYVYSAERDTFVDEGVRARSLLLTPMLNIAAAI